MTETTSEIVERLKLASRPGVSRKLLARKAREKFDPGAFEGEVLEDAFPVSEKVLVPASAAVQLGRGAAVPLQAAPPAAWSEDDERQFKALTARRKAAGFQSRGRDVGAQLIKAGAITPSSDTIVGVIVDIVAERGSITRADLVAAMAAVSFRHPKAQPADKGWCQGYIAGALRNGFLELKERGTEPVSGGE